MKYSKILRDTRHRDPKQVRQTIEMLQSLNGCFRHIHSKYTDQILFDDFQLKWITKERSKNVFIAFKMIERDLKNNPLAHDINSRSYRTENYSNCQEENNFKLDHVINLDISACYPYTAYVEKLISQNTLEFLMKLEKTDRLPALGMLAYNRFVYDYRDGELESINQLTGNWTNIFYYIIQTVNELFLKLKTIAGKYYLLHWVDGIFLKPDTPKEILQTINRTILNCGYVLKVEDCQDFEYKRDGVVIHVDFTKNGEPKTYAFEDSNYSDYAREMARVLHAYREIDIE